jgi:hypothetical protein
MSVAKEKFEQIRKKHILAPGLSSHFLLTEYSAGVVNAANGRSRLDFCPLGLLSLQGFHGLSRRIREMAKIVR